MDAPMSSAVWRDLRHVSLAGATVMLLWMSGWTAALERPLGDLLLRIPRPGGGPPPAVAAILVDEPSLAAHGPLPWPRDRLARLVVATRAAGAAAVVVDMLLAEPTEQSADRALASALDAGPCALAAVLDGHGGWILPAREFGGPRWAAHAHAESSGDGILRRIAFTKQASDLALPALSVAAARLAGWQGAILPGGAFTPDFRLRPAEVPQLSAGELLAGRQPPLELRGRVVFVGISAVGAGDQFFSPVGSRRRPSPGVLVHASVTQSLLSGGTLEQAGALLVGALMIGSCWIALRWRSRFRRARFLAALGTSLAIPMIALVTLWGSGIQLPVLSLWLAIWAAVAIGEATEIRRAQRQADGMLRQLLREGDPLTMPAPKATELPDRLALVDGLQGRMARQLELRSSLLEALEEGVVLWDDAGLPLLANRAAAELWGSLPAAHELIGRDDGAVDPPRRPWQVERGGRTLEIRCVRLAAGTLAVLRDLSESLELERRRREMQRLASHELKTPLASISGFGAMLQRYELSHDELQRVAGLIRGEADRLGAMVGRFLDLERLAALDLEEEMEPVDLGRVVVERCRVLAGAGGDHAGRLELAVADAPCLVQGVASLLGEVVDNLVGNALKYSPPHSTVQVRVHSTGQRVSLEVADHGPGIPPEALPRLWERFYRAPGAAAAGSGLGLALVKTVVERHHGELGVDSELGKGATFRVSFAPIDEGDLSHGTANSGR